MLREIKALYASSAFWALDFETTGLDPELDRIVELAAVKFDKTGNLDAFSTLCDPGRPIPARVSAIHGITDRMVRGKTSERDAIAELVRRLEASIVIAHNAPFDFGFLRAACARYGLKMPACTVFDTRLVAKAAFPGLPSYSLQNLVKTLVLPQGDAHRALADAQACKDLFCKCVEKLLDRQHSSRN